MFSGGKLTVTIGANPDGTASCTAQVGSAASAPCTQMTADLVGAVAGDCMATSSTTGICSGMPTSFVFEDIFMCISLPQAVQDSLPTTLAPYGFTSAATAMAACSHIVRGQIPPAPAAQPTVAPPPAAPGDGRSVPDISTATPPPVGAGATTQPAAPVVGEAPPPPHEEGAHETIPRLQLQLSLGYIHTFPRGLDDRFPTTSALPLGGEDFPNAGNTGDFPNAGGSNQGYGASASNGLNIDVDLIWNVAKITSSFAFFLVGGVGVAFLPTGDIKTTSITDPYVSNTQNPSDFFLFDGKAGVGLGLQLEGGFAGSISAGYYLGRTWTVSGEGYPTDIDMWINYNSLTHGPWARLELGYSRPSKHIGVEPYFEYRYDVGHQHGYVDPSLGVDGREISPWGHSLMFGIAVPISLF